MSARAEVAQLLAGVLPEDVVVLPYARNIDTPAADTVMVRVDRVEPSPVAPLQMRVYRYTLVCVSRFTDDTGPADDDLDALLEDVLHAIDTAALAGTLPQWQTADRGQWLDTAHPAYEVTIAVTHTKEAS